MNDPNLEFTKNDATDIGKKYVEKTIHYYKLRLLKSLTNDISSFIKLFLVGLFSTIIVIFSSISLAIYLSVLLENSSLSYLIVAGIYFIFILIVLLSRKKIEKKVLQKLNKYFS